MPLGGVRSEWSVVVAAEDVKGCGGGKDEEGGKVGKGGKDGEGGEGGMDCKGDEAVEAWASSSSSSWSSKRGLAVGGGMHLGMMV